MNTPNELHDAAHRAAAVEVGRTAAYDFDTVDGNAGHASPVNPAAERIVERDAVVEHERARRAAGANAAQRNALRSRIRAAAAGTAEKRKAGHLPQRVVGR